MSEGKKIGDIIDGLGLTAGIGDDDLVSDVVVISKVVEPDGSVRLSTAWSPGMSWIERLGMIYGALKVEEPVASDVVDRGGPE